MSEKNIFWKCSECGKENFFVIIKEDDKEEGTIELISEKFCCLEEAPKQAKAIDWYSIVD